MTFERQRREALFRSLDNDTDGRISMSEAKVNHQFVDAFARLDRDGNGGIDRQEFERVQPRTIPNLRVLRARRSKKNARRAGARGRWKPSRERDGGG